MNSHYFRFGESNTIGDVHSSSPKVRRVIVLSQSYMGMWWRCNTTRWFHGGKRRFLSSPAVSSSKTPWCLRRKNKAFEYAFGVIVQTSNIPKTTYISSAKWGLVSAIFDAYNTHYNLLVLVLTTSGNQPWFFLCKCQCRSIARQVCGF